MVWIFAGIVLCLAVFVPTFRKVLLIGGGVLLAIVALIAISNSSRRAIPETAVTSQPASPPVLPPPPPREIPVKQIEAGDIRSNFGYPQPGQLNSITARIYNNSADDTLDRAEYRLLIEDCNGKRAAHCATVDDEKGSFYLEVPPGQARDTGVSLKSSWDSVTILGTPRIKVLITKAIAAK